MLQLLIDQQRVTGRGYAARLINSQVVPSYEDLTLPAVQEYRALYRKHRAALPVDGVDASEPARYSFEGFLNARLLSEVLRRSEAAPPARPEPRPPTAGRPLKEFRMFQATTIACALLASLLTASYADAQSSTSDDSTGPTFTVYGSIVANTTANTTQLFIPDIPLWALNDTARLQPPAIGGQAVPDTVAAADTDDFHMTARQTRLGMRVAFGAAGSSWTPSAHVEIDFLGARPSAGHGAVFNQPRMRLALVSLRHASGWTVVAGQDWAIFAPLNPASFSHFAIPLGAGGGNPWMRLPQLRIERSTSIGDTSRLLVQAGVLRPLGGGDAPAAGSLADLPSLSGERSGQPFYEGRVALTGTRLGRPQAFGVSAHYGRERVEPETLSTWGIALDGQVPVHSKVTLAGELWTGSNLDTFQSGIIQGMSIAGARVESVDARGGWLQVALMPASLWTLHAGIGVDDPDTDGLSAAVARTRNRLLWGNAFYRLHPQVTVALQYTHFHTEYRTGTGSGHHANLGIVLSF